MYKLLLNCTLQPHRLLVCSYKNIESFRILSTVREFIMSNDCLNLKTNGYVYVSNLKHQQKHYRQHPLINKYIIIFKDRCNGVGKFQNKGKSHGAENCG